jgi:hypothetical protein
MNTSQIASRAVIALFKTGAWRALKTHGAETREENARHGLTDEARVQVRICSHPALAALTKLHAEARAEHYRLTLPAADEGWRILPGARQIEHAANMAALAARHTSTVAEFVAAYDAERATAPQRLNGLYIPSQWPCAGEVAQRFQFSTRYLPIPSLGQWDIWIQESAAEAEADFKNRLSDAVRKLAGKLADPKAIFRDSLVSNLAEICALAGDMNLRDDPAIAAIAQQGAALAAIPADTLRNDATARKDIAGKASALCSMFSL